MTRTEQIEQDRRTIVRATKAGQRVPQEVKDRFDYDTLRRFGASHEVAVRKVSVGNWNPYDGPEPTPTPERVAEVEARVAVLR